MFGFFASQNRKMRSAARNWVDMADRVWHYRRDLLEEADARELRARTEELRAKLKAKADAADLRLSIEALEPVMLRTGGRIFPKTTMIDNIEFVLIVAIVILGIRAYIAQPFKIPTNSMWPSFYGMTAENLAKEEDLPGPVARVARLLAFGAMRYELPAPSAGEVSVRIDARRNLAYEIVKGRKWLVLPTELKEYTFEVGGTEARIRVPKDFNEFDSVVHETLFGGSEAFSKAVDASIRDRSILPVLSTSRRSPGDARQVYQFRTGKTLQAGKPVLRFDILTGDQLFVDRFSYHFVKPSVGDGFVFTTSHIEQLGTESYYIKRLVGLPGDTLEIKEPVLYRNGAPITGAEAFDMNAHRQGKYRGYLDSTHFRDWAWPHLRRGETLQVPSNSFFALGDNSANSYDGRGWGFVPAKDAIGRPLFIFYPFTKRWGLSH